MKRRPPTRRPAGEEGYALIAAVVAMALFSYIAYAMLAAERGALAGISALKAQARLAAAADAGLVLAATRVGGTGAGPRWSIDSRPYRARFDDIDLAIRIEDERGKIRLAALSEDQARLMFENAGVGGRRLDELTDAFLDWTDSDDERRPYGAEAEDYRMQGIRPRNGALRTMGELARIRGMDRMTYDRIAPAATLFFGESGGFSPSTAQPLAVAVMTGTGMGSPQVIERQRELAGQRVAIDLGEAVDLRARALTVRIVARDRDGGQLTRATIIEFPQGRGSWEIRYRN